jgi:hypothetical protein
MTRRLAAFAAMSVLALALGAAPVAASAVQRFSFLAVEAGNAQDPSGPLVIPCGPNTYTATAGSFAVVTRDPSLAAHITASGVWVEDQSGAAYSVLGAESYNDPAGRLTSKLMIVDRAGGIVDSINVVLRYDRAGTLLVGLDLRTCGF